MRNKVYALQICGTDGDIAAYTLRHLLGEGIDKILIDLVPTEDETNALVHELAGQYPDQIEIFPSEDVSIWGSRRMTRLANIAYDRGVELVLPCDADELFFSRNGIPLADEIRKLQGWLWGVQVYMHLASATDSLDPNPYLRMVHRQKEPLRLNKIICRYNPRMVIDEGNHGASWQDGRKIAGDWCPIEMRHFPYRSADQFVKKVKVTEKAILATPGYPQEWGVHYKMYANTLKIAGEQALRDWYYRWFYLGAPEQAPENAGKFDINPAPYRGV